MEKASDDDVKLLRFEVFASPDITTFEVRVGEDPVQFNAGVGATYVRSGDRVTLHYAAQGSPGAEISGRYWIEGQKHPLFSEVLTSSGKMVGFCVLRVPGEAST